MVRKFIFFTGDEVFSNYCIINIKNYLKRKPKNKKLIFIDPDVMQLKKHAEYPMINILHEKADNLGENEFISIDYPPDMNIKYTASFIARTILNNFIYSDNMNYICTVQVDPSSLFKSFSRVIGILTPILKKSRDGRQKIMGIGGLCRYIYIYPMKSDRSSNS